MTTKPTQPTIEREQQLCNSLPEQKDVWGIAHTAHAVAKADSILDQRPAMFLLD